MQRTFSGIQKLASRMATLNKFSTTKVHGNLSDSDRIFTNLYRDGDPFIQGAIKRVIHSNQY